MGGIMCEKEQCTGTEKRKQGMMNELLLSPIKPFVESSVKVSTSASKEIDKTIASFFIRTAFPLTLLIRPVLHACSLLDSLNKILFKVIKPHPANNYLGSYLTKHPSRLGNLKLRFLAIKKVWSNNFFGWMERRIASTNSESCSH